MNAVMFFKSMWPEVKQNAALFVGNYYMQSLDGNSCDIIIHLQVTCWGTCLLINQVSFPRNIFVKVSQLR